ncbi:MAG: hypothetical protein AVO35_04210 [Candidatus Aegiribacteria sp. MLS_C]|nr:MAG: hypothetical protein AVO35_04210 [Candidatus Aegiribacteria sp. MLS_C]
MIGVILAWLLLRSAAGEGGTGAALDGIASRTTGADPMLLAWAFALFVLSQVLRALRWMLLGFRRNYRFGLSMAVTSIHVGLGHLLPFRLADLAFVGLFRHYGEVPVGHGTASVVLAKLLDLMAMGVVIGSAVAAGVGEMVLAAAVLVVTGLTGMVFLSPVLRFMAKPARWTLSRFLPGGRTHWYDDLIEASSVRGRKGRLAAAFAVSILVWAAKLYMFSVLLESLGVTGIPQWKIFLASGITNMIMAIPVHGLLSIGTTEAGWTAAFAMVGVEGSMISSFDVVEAGFSVHILWLLMALVLMIMALPLLAIDRRRNT